MKTPVLIFAVVAAVACSKNGGDGQAASPPTKTADAAPQSAHDAGSQRAAKPKPQELSQEQRDAYQNGLREGRRMTKSGDYAAAVEACATASRNRWNRSSSETSFASTWSR